MFIIIRFIALFCFSFSAQKPVEESANHPVMAALPAPPTLRAVSLFSSVLLAFVCILLQHFIIVLNVPSASIQIVLAAYHYNYCLCCTKPPICLSICERPNLIGIIVTLRSCKSLVGVINVLKRKME